MGNKKTSTSLWVERVSALHRNLMRKFAASESLQLVHIEIIQYLSICNKYSNTTQSLSEYLGQTKGSISQSLGFLENEGFINRQQDKKDKRIFHLFLTNKGLEVVERLNQSIDFLENENINSSLNILLTQLQKKNQLQSFGICKSCKYNQKKENGLFTCGLTLQDLSTEDIEKICREHLVA